MAVPWGRSRQASALVGVLCLVLAAACGGTGSSPGESAHDRATSTPAPSPSASASAPPDVPLPAVQDVEKAGATRFPVAAADWVRVVNGSAWMTLASKKAVRLEPQHGRTTASIPTRADTCTGMAAGFGSLWVGECSLRASTVLRIDPRKGTVQGRVQLPGELQEEGVLGAGMGFVWAVTFGSPQRLLRIDPATNRVTGQFPLTGSISGVRAGLGGLWVVDSLSGTLQRIDPASGKTIATIPVGNAPRFFDVGEGGVWVQDNGDGTLTRVDPASNRVVARIRVDDGPVSGGDLAVGGGFVWARVTNSLVSEIDPRTNTVVARYGPAAGSGSVAADDDAVWITAHDEGSVYRLPLR